MKRKYVTLDPGSVGTGFAIWDEGEWLLQCINSRSKFYCFSPEITGTFYKPDKIAYALEKLVYRYNVTKAFIENAEFFATTLKGQAAAGKGSLVILAQYIGRIQQIFFKSGVEVTLVTPQQWKGTMSKDAVIKRIKKYSPSTTASAHAWDAVGIGLYLTGVINQAKGRK